MCGSGRLARVIRAHKLSENIWFKNHILEKILDVALCDDGQTMECGDRARILDSEFVIEEIDVKIQID